MTESDHGAFADICNALEASILGRPGKVDAGTVAGWLRADTASLMIDDEEGPVAGVFADEYAKAGFYGGSVHPRARDRGHGTRLAEFAEQWIAGREAQKIHTWTIAGDSAAETLFTGRGYREARRFWDMVIDLGDEPPASADVAIDTFDGTEAVARAFHAALEEAFSDHWEHHATPFDKWWEEKQKARDYDPSLWFLIRDGDEVAAIARNDPDRHGGGYVGALGVRRAYRSLGYAKALLNHTFREFHRRGKRRVSLGVDATNPTGATHLYESLGMHIELESVVYEKLLP